MSFAQGHHKDTICTQTEDTGAPLTMFPFCRGRHTDLAEQCDEERAMNMVYRGPYVLCVILRR